MAEDTEQSVLETLVYMSTARQAMSNVALHSLLTKARANNRAADVTGVLLYAEQSFIQVLEGPPQALDETMARVESDPRHKNITRLLREPIEARCFSSWAMGYRGCDETFEDLFALSREALEKLGAQGACAKPLILLRSFFNTSYPRLSA